jgi:hypothetical protein
VPQAAPDKAQSLIKFYEQGYERMYESQSDHFKSLVAKTNRLMPFYIALINRPEKISKSPTPSNFIQLLAVLKGEFKFQCPECGCLFEINRGLSRHRIVCASMRQEHKMRKLLFGFSQNEYYCPCDGSQFDSVQSCQQHLLTHSKAELWRWSINRDILLASEPIKFKK